jgi:hypothetical protein
VTLWGSGFPYCWVWDASFTMDALWVAACPDEACGLGSAGSPSTLEPDVIYDAANPGDTIVTATEEGLSVDTAIERHRLFASRAIRFVAA